MRSFLLFSWMFISVGAKAATIQFNDFDSLKVCDLLRSGTFIVSQNKVDEYTIETKRSFSTKTSNFQINCDQISDSRTGSLTPIKQSANVVYDESIPSEDTKVGISPLNSAIVFAELSNKQEVATLFEAMYSRNYFSSEKVEVEINGIKQKQWRLSILCKKQQPISNSAISCQAVSVKN